MNVSFDVKFDFNNQVLSECLSLSSELTKQKRNQEAISLLSIAERLYHQKSQIYYQLSKAYKGVDEDKVLFYLDKCIEVNPNFRRALVDIIEYRPEYYKQLVNLAHKTRARGHIERSDNLYRLAFNQQKKHNIVNRTVIVQNYINLKKITNYLEIGVFVGHHLMQIKAPNIMVVDPFIQVPFWRNNTDPTHHYYEVTSDDFFEQQSNYLEKNKIQACLIDGLHTYEQSLKDVLNTLDNCEDDCLIVMHDCKPVNKAAAQPTMALGRQTEGYNGLWMGDVYKTILWLRSFRDDVQTFVLDCDCGLGIVKKGKPESTLNLTEAEIEKLTYDDLVKDMDNLLNLKPASHYWDSAVFK